jgi:NitT/TauT family transport system permease protein
MRRSKNSSVISYPHTLAEKMYSIFLMPILIVAAIFAIVKLLHFSGNFSQISFWTLGLAGLSTTYRLAVAYCFAVVVSVPLAILATKSSLLEKIFLPTFDILESVPILAFFPILILLFVRFNFLNGAAIFILFLSMLWNIVFTLIGGIK